MKTIGRFFQLLRWPNLVFIALTQALFHFCIIRPSAYGEHYSFPLQLNQHLFWLLCVASVLIAGAGYIINDYFDINIDLVNKPDKMVLEKSISRRWAIIWHMTLSGIGLLISAYISYRLGNWLIALGNFVCILLLWFYSTSYKRQLLIGNVLIALMTAWVVLVLLVAELPGWWTGQLHTELEKATAVRLGRIGLLYAGFAFILTIIREVVKDMEDLPGDKQEGCRTMPIVWGITASKVFAHTWLVIVMALVGIMIVYVLPFNWWLMAAYLALAVFVPLAVVFRLLLKAGTTHEFAQLSRYIKIVMLTGILSMPFFMLYTR